MALYLVCSICFTLHTISHVEMVIILSLLDMALEKNHKPPFFCNCVPKLENNYCLCFYSCTEIDIFLMVILNNSTAYRGTKLTFFPFSNQVFPFGSVPLKTYLPDGDIDLAAFGYTCSDESLANEVRAILESEERRKDAEFEIKDVQYINAEVRLRIALCFSFFWGTNCLFTQQLPSSYECSFLSILYKAG